ASPTGARAPTPAAPAWDGLIDKLPIGIAVCDRDGRFLQVNPALCALTRYSAEELSQQTFFEDTHSDDVELDRSLYARQVAGDLENYSIVKRFIQKGGTALWISVNSSAVVDKSGRFLYAVRVVQDIHRQKDTEARLRDSERRMRELLESVPAALYT